jgi:hypothetical protein
LAANAGNVGEGAFGEVSKNNDSPFPVWAAAQAWRAERGVRRIGGRGTTFTM